MSEKFKVDKVELGLSVDLMIIGGALPVFIDDVWGLGPIILGFGDYIRVWRGWSCRNTLQLVLLQKKKRKQKETEGK